MSQRVIVGLNSAAEVTPALRGALASLGAEQVGEPSASMPDVVVATLPEGADIEGFMRSVRALPGVRYVERDAMRFSS